MGKRLEKRDKQALALWRQSLFLSLISYMVAVLATKLGNSWVYRKLGTMLAGMEKQKPGQYQQRSHDVTVAPTLADMGI